MPAEDLDRIVTKWRRHIPFRCRFPSAPQQSKLDGFSMGPGPDDHIGTIIDVTYDKHVEFRVLCPKLLEISPEYNKKSSDTNVRVIPPNERQLHVLSGFQFMMCCYYHWDINQNLKMGVPYIRDFCIGVHVEMEPGKWEQMKNIFPQEVRDGKGLEEWLVSDRLPKPDRNFNMGQYQRFTLTHVTKLYGRNPGLVANHKKPNKNPFRHKPSVSKEPVNRKKIGFGGIYNVRPLTQLSQLDDSRAPGVAEATDGDSFVEDDKIKKRKKSSANQVLLLNPSSSVEIPLIVNPIVIPDQSPMSYTQSPEATPPAKGLKRAKGTSGGRGKQKSVGETKSKKSSSSRARAKEKSSFSLVNYDMIDMDSGRNQLFAAETNDHRGAIPFPAGDTKKRAGRPRKVDAPKLILASTDPLSFSNTSLPMSPLRYPIQLSIDPAPLSPVRPPIQLSADPDPSNILHFFNVYSTTRDKEEEPHLFDSLDDNLNFGTPDDLSEPSLFDQLPSPPLVSTDLPLTQPQLFGLTLMQTPTPNTPQLFGLTPMPTPTPTPTTPQLFGLTPTPTPTQTPPQLFGLTPTPTPTPAQPQLFASKQSLSIVPRQSSSSLPHMAISPFIPSRSMPFIGSLLPTMAAYQNFQL